MLHYTQALAISQKACLYFSRGDEGVFKYMGELAAKKKISHITHIELINLIHTYSHLRNAEFVSGDREIAEISYKYKQKLIDAIQQTKRKEK